MTTFPTEEQPALVVDAGSPKQKREMKPKVAAQKPSVQSAKAKAGKKATADKKLPKPAKSAKAANPAKAQEARGAREGSKTAEVLDLLRRPDGAALKEIMKATGWQPHSVRGFISGTLGKKMGLVVVSTKAEDGERVYSLPK
jgi:outer membrane biosynthesis protein TonB